MRGPCVKDQRGGCVVTYPYHLGVARQEVQDDAYVMGRAGALNVLYTQCTYEVGKTVCKHASVTFPLHHYSLFIQGYP